MGLEPLKEWQCDYCGEIIESAKDGWLEWLVDDKLRAHGFKLVHHRPASPNKDRAEGCYHYGKRFTEASAGLGDFVGADGLTRLLAFLDVGQVDPEDKGPWVRSTRELAELTRRLMVPYYEEARLYWNLAEADGFFADANEVSPYLVRTLKKIIEQYGASKLVGQSA